MGQPTPTTPPQATLPKLPGVEEVGGLAQTLEVYGGWGVASLFIIFFGVACWAYYKQGRRYEEERKGDTKQFVDMLESNAKIVTACTEQMKRMETKVEEMTRSNERTDTILESHKTLVERMHQQLDNSS